jgi:alpha-beta hydrolase superfamily lysophospholipase
LQPCVHQTIQFLGNQPVTALILTVRLSHADHQEDIRLNADSVTYPVLVMHGTSDRLSMIEGSEAFFNAAKRCVVALSVIATPHPQSHCLAVLF